MNGPEVSLFIDKPNARFGYVFVKAASFFGAFVFPVLSEAFGKSGATFSVSILSLVGFLSAKFILPEMYGYVETEEVQASITSH